MNVSVTKRRHPFEDGKPVKSGRFFLAKKPELASRPDKKLQIIALGGNEEIGARNMYLIEYGQDIVIIDMGLMFPEEDMPGIDYIIPNIGYLRGKEKNIRGVIVTHGHYDHIGGIPHLMPKLGNPPLYATALTCGIIARRQDDYKGTPKLNIHPITTRDTLHLGTFKVEFFGVSHNIPDAVGVIVHTPQGVIVHTGDFKLDFGSPADGGPEIAKIAKLADQQVLALLSDSTGADKPGHQLTELEILENLDDLFRKTSGRLIIGTFSSLIGRLAQIILLAEKYGRKVIIEGFSMRTNMEIAQRLGYVKFNRDTIIPVEAVDDYPPNRILVLGTGAQGEGKAVLMRIANHEHRKLRIQPGDTVVFSSSVIPGNERSVQRLVDRLYREGAEVINYQMMDIHAGGHAKQEDLKLMLLLVNPRYFIPIMGSHTFLHLHARLARSIGFDQNHIFIADNGQIIEFDGGRGRLTDKHVPTDYVMVDGLGVGDVGEVVLRDRQLMAADGMLVIFAIINSKTGELVSEPDVLSRGFIFMKGSEKLIGEVKTKVREIVASGRTTPPDWAYVRNKIRDQIGQFLFNRTQRRPMVLPVVTEV